MRSTETTVFSCMRSEAYSTRALNSASLRTCFARARISRQTSLNTKSVDPDLTSSISSLQASYRMLFKHYTSSRVSWMDH